MDGKNVTIGVFAVIIVLLGLYYIGDQQKQQVAPTHQKTRQEQIDEYNDQKWENNNKVIDDILHPCKFSYGGCS